MSLWLVGYLLVVPASASFGYLAAGMMTGSKVLELHRRVGTTEAMLATQAQVIADLTKALQLILAGLEDGSVGPDAILFARRLIE